MCSLLFKHAACLWAIACAYVAPAVVRIADLGNLKKIGFKSKFKEECSRFETTARFDDSCYIYCVDRCSRSYQ